MIKPMGGHKRRAWRLKKKYNKWFFKIISEITLTTIQELPKAFFEGVFDCADYEFVRLYKED